MQKENETRYEYRDVDDLIPYARNARTHSAEQVNKLAGSIKEFGFINPIIISEDGGVLAGHGRIMAANKLGIKRVPCIVENHLTETQKKAYIIADNKLALDAGWDEEMLKVELEELNQMDFDLSLTGFDDEEIKMYLDSNAFEAMSNESNESEIDVDEESEPITKLGDIWLLGEHRLMCGDCTVPENVKKLFGNDKPNLMVTDPPYGVNYDTDKCETVEESKSCKYHRRTKSKDRAGKVLNDDRIDWEDAYRLFDGDIAYVWHANVNSDIVIQGLKNCGFKINQFVIWNKDIFAFGRSDYQWKHEPCVYATRGKHNWQGGRKQTTVWDIPSINSFEMKEKEGAWGHSTQKPIECMKRPIENNTCEGEYVYDPFLGSGTTIIAAERTGRK
jgi:DNA modification methylase